MPVVAIGLMLSVVVSMVWASQAGWVQNTGDSAVYEATPGFPLDTKLLMFNDLDNGAVEVRDQITNSVVHVFPSGEGSFVRGILRSLTRERRTQGFDDNKPFELRAESAQRLVLLDHATGTSLLLNAFGPNNVATFAQFLDSTVLEPSASRIQR
jgi:putative photosynthetic complex assembly protein